MVGEAGKIPKEVMNVNTGGLGLDGEERMCGSIRRAAQALER